ncbi:MAG: ABC transporter permease [Sulfurospirillaceae bacterium]|nr:ABC transporter permease [Sulfurospirillaceae bacterium]MDD3462365.1 ABC transporter permease [Sulfurospirillaceae bacterium]
MKSLNAHISVILSLCVLLFSFQFVIFTNSVVSDYAQKIVNDYSIIVVSSSEIKEDEIRAQIPDIKSLEEISSKKILDRLKNDMSSKNLALLQVALPKFYSIKLNSIPDKKRVENIKTKLSAYKNISRVETFARTHEKIFKMFSILQGVAYVFSFFIAMVALLLMFKQIKIWIYEHNKRMSIMTLFGASFFMKSAILYRMTIVDSVISTALISLFYYFMPKVPIIQEVASELDILIPSIDLIKDSGILLGISLLFSFLVVTAVSRNTAEI